jgi:poly(A) polymerase
MADLARRDFAINAQALRIDASTGTLAEPRRIIDPLDGRGDLDRGLVRAVTVEVFERDPLRLLRAFRFAATLDLEVEKQTLVWIGRRAGLISRPAPERLNYELELIMASPRAGKAFADLAAAGLLTVIFPELARGQGLAQPASHHLDVMDHNLAALAAMEEVLTRPAHYFPDQAAVLTAYLALPRRPCLLKWAALFHDLGKPETSAVKEDGRATFYNHDRAGARLFGSIARRLRWSRERCAIVSRLIELHMYPFHLNNARQKTGITPRACLRLVKAAGEELPGLFLLTLADSLAASGPLKPAGMEENLAVLYRQIEEVYHKSVQPVLQGPKLLNGHDLRSLGLEPGPLFGKILDSLEQARVAGEVGNREEALAWVSRFLAARRQG